MKKIKRMRKRPATPPPTITGRLTRLSPPCGAARPTPVVVVFLVVVVGLVVGFFVVSACTVK